MYEIISYAKATKTTSDDKITMDCIKQIPESISLIMTHLANKMIRMKTFPKCLKKVRILLLWKQNK